MGQLIVEDTINTWPVLAVGFVGAALCSLIIIAVMRWVAGPIVWLSVIGVIALLSVGEYGGKCFLLNVLEGELVVVFFNCDDLDEALLNLA